MVGNLGTAAVKILEMTMPAEMLTSPVTFRVVVPFELPRTMPPPGELRMR